MSLPGNRALLKVVRVQFIAPYRNLPPLPGRADDFVERSITTPVLEPILSRPVPDDHQRFTIVLLQDIAQKSAHTLDNHQQTLPVRERLRDAPREFFLYLSNWILRQVTIVVLTEPGVWHKRQSTPSEGDLSGGRCTLEVRVEDRIQRKCRVVLPKLPCLLPAKGRERHISVTGSVPYLVIDAGHMGGILRLPRMNREEFLLKSARFRRSWKDQRLLCRADKTFGPTRSDSGNTKAAQETLRTRMFSGLFQGGRQARLHALPVNAQLAPGREGESDGIEHAGQPGAIEIPLDQLVEASPTVGTTVEPLRERLTRVVLTAVAVLRGLGLKRGNLMQLDGASSCNHALDGVYKAPRGTHPHTSAKAALPALVADLFDPQIIAQADDLVGQFAMQAAPVRGQSPLGRRQAPAGLLIAVTLPPHAPSLASTSFFDAALCIVVLGIVGPTLSLQMALQPPACARIGCQFLGQQQQARRADLGDDGQRGGPQIESHRSLAGPVCGFLQRMTFENELHRIHQAAAVGASCLGRGGWLAQQAHVLDALL